MTDNNDMSQTINDDLFWACADEWFVNALKRLFDGEYSGAIEFPFYSACTSVEEFYNMCSRIGMHYMVQRCKKKDEELKELGDDSSSGLEFNSTLHKMVQPPVDQLCEFDDVDEWED